VLIGGFAAHCSLSVTGPAFSVIKSADCADN
jgi:hypothetical protein